ncbi:hypothetical protein IAT40_004281 [Kwoniella sp. CBS 6097]
MSISTLHSLPPEVQALIFEHLTQQIPAKIILLSQHHYNAVIPSLYQSIILSEKNITKFRYGIHRNSPIQQPADGQSREGDSHLDHGVQHETGSGPARKVFWGRKAEACRHVRHVVFADPSSMTPLTKNSDNPQPSTTDTSRYSSSHLFPNATSTIFSHAATMVLSYPIERVRCTRFRRNVPREKALGDDTCARAIATYIPPTASLCFDMTGPNVTSERIGGLFKTIKVHLQGTDDTLIAYKGQGREGQINIHLDVGLLSALQRYTPNQPDFRVFVSSAHGPGSHEAGNLYNHSEVPPTATSSAYDIANGNNSPRTIAEIGSSFITELTWGMLTSLRQHSVKIEVFMENGKGLDAEVARVLTDRDSDDADTHTTEQAHLGEGRRRGVYLYLRDSEDGRCCCDS